LAAGQGQPDAQYQVGYCYDYGKGVEKDEKKGCEYYLLAAHQGHADARLRVEDCHKHGIGVEKDEKVETKETKEQEDNTNQIT